ncbi:MAG: CHAT domain-containing protein [Symploca sp. SIO2E6]|nr:CHAT domain-containing protein [Symploca sp. SIO2E6]
MSYCCHPVSSDKHFRWKAVEALGHIGSESAIPILMEALQHSDYYIHWKAMEALGEIGTEGAVVALIETLKHSEDYFCRRVVEALGQIGSEHAILALQEALQHSDSSVRWKAVEALGKIGTESVIPTLIKSLQHSDDYVRLSAVEALGKIGNESALPSLLRLQLGSPRDYIRDAIFAIQERCQFYNYNIYQLGQVSFDESIPQLSSVTYNLNKPRESSQLKTSSDTVMKKILVLAANPKGTSQLRVEEEEREIKERLRLAGYGKVPINKTEATRPRDIQQAMVDFKPQIVHFIGHGAGQDGLVFEDAIGQEKLVTSEALASLFKLFYAHVECVVLNACYSEFQAEAIARHINYVVGMSQDIGDPAAIEFSVGFYIALGAGESYEFAYELGCNAIQLEGIQEHLTPILKKNNRADL